jgi:hypothetical protein
MWGPRLLPILSRFKPRSRFPLLLSISFLETRNRICESRHPHILLAETFFTESFRTYISLIVFLGQVSSLWSVWHTIPFLKVGPWNILATFFDKSLGFLLNPCILLSSRIHSITVLSILEIATSQIKLRSISFSSFTRVCLVDSLDRFKISVGIIVPGCKGIVWVWTMSKTNLRRILVCKLCLCGSLAKSWRFSLIWIKRVSLRSEVWRHLSG